MCQIFKAPFCNVQYIVNLSAITMSMKKGSLSGGEGFNPVPLLLKESYDSVSCMRPMTPILSQLNPNYFLHLFLRAPVIYQHSYVHILLQGLYALFITVMCTTHSGHLIFLVLLLLSIGPRWLLPRMYCSPIALLYYPKTFQISPLVSYEVLAA